MSDPNQSSIDYVADEVTGFFGGLVNDLINVATLGAFDGDNSSEELYDSDGNRTGTVDSDGNYTADD